MKKITLTTTALLLAFALFIPVYASASTPSVQAQPAPEVVTSQVDGQTVYATITNADGSVTNITEPLEIVSYEKRTDASANVNTALSTAYEEIENAENLSSLNKDLPNVASSVFGSDTKDEDLVVKDLFFLNVPEQAKPKDGSTLTIKFKPTSDGAVVVMVKCENAWVVVPAENVTYNYDKTVTVKFTELCPVAFVAKTEASDPVDVPPVEPEKKSNTGLIAGIIAAVAAAGGGTAFFLNKNKKSK